MALVVTDIGSVCRNYVSCQACGCTIRVNCDFIDSCLSQPSDEELFKIYQLADVASWINGRRVAKKIYELCEFCKSRATLLIGICMICGDPSIDGTYFCQKHVCKSKCDGKQCKHARMMYTMMCPEHTLLHMLKGRESRNPHLVANLKQRC
jgi:hypothetical protein